MTLLDISGLGKRYGAVTALEGVDLAVPAGSRTAIVGPSGSGKTTLLRLIAGFEAPDQGRIVFDGKLMADATGSVPAHKRAIGLVAQDGALFPHLNVADNIGFGLERKGPDRDSRILALLETVELPRAMLARRPHELSGGQQQRVALARALARQPKLMLLDEPFSALDAGLRETMRKAVAKVLQIAGITALLVTHDQAEALSFADQVAILQEGRLVQAGSPQELYRNPRDRATAAFLGSAIVLPAKVGDGWADCVLGRLAIEVGPKRGYAEIMLRPEQIQLRQVSVGGADPRVCSGRVVQIEFGGTASTIEIMIPGADAPGRDDTRLLVKMSSLELPPIGSTVEISVLGGAHVFE